MRYVHYFKLLVSRRYRQRLRAWQTMQSILPELVRQLPLSTPVRNADEKPWYGPSPTSSTERDHGSVEYISL